jgi:hypothetical protein
MGGFFRTRLVLSVGRGAGAAALLGSLKARFSLGLVVANLASGNARQDSSATRWRTLGWMGKGKRAELHTAEAQFQRPLHLYASALDAAR